MVMGGLPALAAAPDNAICKKITVAGTTVYSPVCTVSGIGTSYFLSEGDPSITPVVKNADKTLVFGTDYTVTLDGVAKEAFPITISTGGLHTLSITGKGDYQGTESYTILVDETTLPTGTYTVSEDLSGVLY